VTVNKTDPRYFVGSVQQDVLKLSRPILRQSLTNTQTWTIPSGVTQIVAIPVSGGGGGGGNGYQSQSGAGGGGGGGGFYPVQLAVTPGENISVVVGQGGAGGFTTSQVAGYTGGTGGVSSVTYKGQVYQVAGGEGGFAPSTASPEGGGGQRGNTTSYPSGVFIATTTKVTQFATAYLYNIGGLSPDAAWVYPNVQFMPAPYGSYKRPSYEMNGGAGAPGGFVSGFTWGGGGNGPTAGGGGGHMNDSRGSRGGNTFSSTGGAGVGQCGGGGAGFLGAGSDATNTVGGAGGSGGGGGGGQGTTTLGSRGGSGGAGCVLIYY
jgi:hypothetical protein